MILNKQTYMKIICVSVSAVMRAVQMTHIKDNSGFISQRWSGIDDHILRIYFREDYFESEGVEYSTGKRKINWTAVNKRSRWKMRNEKNWKVISWTNKDSKLQVHFFMIWKISSFIYSGKANIQDQKKIIISNQFLWDLQPCYYYYQFNV